GLDLRAREHEKLVGLAGLPEDAHAIRPSRRFSHTADPAIRDADAVAQPYRSGHQPSGVFASSATRRFFSARSSSQRAVTSRTLAAGPSGVPVDSESRAMVNSTEMEVPSFRIAGTAST